MKNKKEDKGEEEGGRKKKNGETDLKERKRRWK